MKTFRCTFFNNDERTTIDVIASDARSAVSRVVAQSAGIPFQRVDVEDERGLAYMWQPAGHYAPSTPIQQHAA